VRSGEELGKELSAQLHEWFDILRVNEICREFRDIAKAEPEAAQDIAEIIEDLAALTVEIALTSDNPIPPDGKLTGDEEKCARLNARYMRIKPLRRTGVIWIGVMHTFCHGASSSAVSGGDRANAAGAEAVRSIFDV
jgi:hypothetical protein